MLLVLILISSEEPDLLLLEIVEEVPNKVKGLFGNPVETDHIQGPAQVFEIQRRVHHYPKDCVVGDFPHFDAADIDDHLVLLDFSWYECCKSGIRHQEIDTIENSITAEAIIEGTTCINVNDGVHIFVTSIAVQGTLNSYIHGPSWVLKARQSCLSHPLIVLYHFF